MKAAQLLLVALLASFGAAVGASPLPAPPAGSTWKLFWADEFDGPDIDIRKWNVKEQRPRGRGLWSSEQVEVKDGKLVFRISPRNGTLYAGAVDSFRKFETAYGLFVFRAKLGTVPGHRPAIWLTSEGVKRVGDEGLDGTEIDVMEQPGRDGMVHFNLHWDGYGNDHKTTGVRARLPSTEWIDFALWWSPSEYRFYMDNRLVWRTKAGGVSRNPEFIRMGIEIPETERQPERMYQALERAGGDTFAIDFVRVYKLSD